jgi:hypothetical protein
MAIYHLHWLGQRNGIQDGWYILDTHHQEYGRIEWRGALMRVVFNDGSLFRVCASHADTFEAASDLIALYEDLEARREDTEVDFPI